MINPLALLAGAFVIDSIVGDPRSSYHPVVLIGRMISFLESRLLRPENSSVMKRAIGSVLVVVTLAVTYFVVWLIVKELQDLDPLLDFLGESILLSFAISPRSLAEAGQGIYKALLASDFVLARQKVGWIVGRDTAALDESEITRATVETIAENIVDGIISPLFFACIGGVPLAFLYRAVNTLDSMVGYRNEKYKDFGKVAARVDDVFNYIPARITGLLIILAAFFCGMNARAALRMIWRDAAKHPSPNSGISEAGVAGAIGVQLGGLNYYGGIPSQRAYLGDSLRPLVAKDIHRASVLLYVTTLLFIAGVGLWIVLAPRIITL